MLFLTQEDMGADASILKQQKRELVENIKASLKEVSVEVISVRSLVARLTEYLPSVVDACEQGLDCPFENLKLVRNLQDILKFEETRLVTLALAESQKYSSHELASFGFELGETGERLNFSQDAEYLFLQKQLNQRKKKLKAAYEHHKNAIGILAYVDEETGEIISQVDIKTTSKTILKRIKQP